MGDDWANLVARTRDGLVALGDVSGCLSTQVLGDGTMLKFFSIDENGTPAPAAPGRAFDEKMLGLVVSLYNDRGIVYSSGAASVVVHDCRRQTEEILVYLEFTTLETGRGTSLSVRDCIDSGLCGRGPPTAVLYLGKWKIAYRDLGAALESFAPSPRAEPSQRAAERAQALYGENIRSARFCRSRAAFTSPDGVEIVLLWSDLLMLPKELLVMVLEWLPPRDLMSAAASCRAMAAAARSAAPVAIGRHLWTLERTPVSSDRELASLGARAGRLYARLQKRIA